MLYYSTTSILCFSKFNSVFYMRQKLKYQFVFFKIMIWFSSRLFCPISIMLTGRTDIVVHKNSSVVYKSFLHFFFISFSVISLPFKMIILTVMTPNQRSKAGPGQSTQWSHRSAGHDLTEGIIIGHRHRQAKRCTVYGIKKC